MYVCMGMCNTQDLLNLSQRQDIQDHDKQLEFSNKRFKSEFLKFFEGNSVLYIIKDVVTLKEL